MIKTPAHKQTDPDKAPGQQVNHITPLGFVIQPREKTLEEYIQRKTRQEAFNEVKAEKYLQTVNHPHFKEANRLVRIAEDLLTDMGMSLDDARGWIQAWSSGAGDGAE